MVRRGKFLKLSEAFREASDDLIRVVSGKKGKVIKEAAKAVLAIDIDIAETGGSGSDSSVIDLNGKVDGDLSVKATMSRDFTKTGGEKAFKKAVANYDLAQQNVQE